jgi:hypothetical protein
MMRTPGPFTASPDDHRSHSIAGAYKKRLVFAIIRNRREASLKSHRCWAAIVLALGGVIAPAAAKAQAPDQRMLLSAFCDPSNVEGSTCKKAKDYPGGRACEVKLGEQRYSGKFLAAGTTLLVIGYESSCEAHATDFGGSVVFDQAGGVTTFRGYQPGYQANECVTVARNETRDRLVCLTGHLGQGHLESGLAEIVFSQKAGKDIELAFDFFVTADDSFGAYGSNTVSCKKRSQYFGLSKLGAGPRPDSVAVTIDYADAATIKTACRRGFPRPKEVFGKLAPGEAYVPEGYEKQGRFVVDLGMRKVAPEPGEPAASR